MILGLDHIAIICSSEQSIDFYKHLGLEETSREDRGYDILVFLKGFGFTLEVFIAPPSAACGSSRSNGFKTSRSVGGQCGGHAEEFGNQCRADKDKRRETFYFPQRPRRAADRVA